MGGNTPGWEEMGGKHSRAGLGRKTSEMGGEETQLGWAGMGWDGMRGKHTWVEGRDTPEMGRKTHLGWGGKATRVGRKSHQGKGQQEKPQ